MKKRSQTGKQTVLKGEPRDAVLTAEERRIAHADECHCDSGCTKGGVEALQLRNSWAFSWGHGFFFALGIAVVLFSQSLLSKPRQDATLPVQASAPSTHSMPSWGSLEFTSIELERPDDSLAVTSAANPNIRWQFENMGEEQLSTLFHDPEISETVSKRLSDKSRWQAVDTGIAVSPSEESVLELSPLARKKIYGVLAQWPANFAQLNPIRIRADKLDAWMKISGLSESNRRIFQKLLYPQGSDLLFADYEMISARCAPEERKRFAKAGSRIEALVASLRVTPETDIDALVRYWGRWEGGHQMIPFIQALSAVPGGASISVSYLFPPFARLRLYTYPQSAVNTPEQHEDCFWTAMNFFNEKPDYRFCNPQFIMETLRKDYVPVTGERAFGDLLLITENGSKALHMCVHVADDVVFTKNGAHALQPWVLMRLHEMLRQYVGGAPIQIRCYRRIAK